ncbi:MAG: SDR family oxidoreductase, partial [Spirulinaceae cyanobacterium RM2_2_10]|nr:SDR family oxidoreductase [Spirulinaceae cyanobacterium RM2_2_10]
MGSAAAYHLAKDGRRVLLLEQFQLGHTRGSSHGGSRITRYTNPDVDDARVMPATYELWRTLEAERAATLLKLTGGLFFAPADDPFMIASQHALNAFDYPYRLLSAAEQRAEFPQFQPPADWIALYQADSGILAASACVEALAAQGACVAALDINPAITTLFGSASIFGQICDVTDSGQLKTAVEETVNHFGGLDIVICNAGMFPKSQTIADMDGGAWARSLDLNLTSHQLLIQHGIPYLKVGSTPPCDYRVEECPRAWPRCRCLFGGQSWANATGARRRPGIGPIWHL